MTQEKSQKPSSIFADPPISDSFKVELTLNIDGTKTEVPTGHIKSWSVDIQTHAFDAAVEFVVFCGVKNDKDKLNKDFITHKLISVELRISNPDHDPAPDPLVLVGFVTRKAIEEQVVQESKVDMLLFRRYRIEFADAAQVFWRQHYPCELYSEATLKDVIEAQVVKGIKIDLKWKFLTLKHLSICLTCHEHEQGASFYDWLLYVLDRFGGFFEYDCKTNKYLLADKKSSGTAEILSWLDVETLAHCVDETPRHNLRMLNAYSEKPETKDIPKGKALEGLRKDVLLRTPVPAEFSRIEFIENSKIPVPRDDMIVQFKRFPPINFRPGTFLKFAKKLWQPHHGFKKQFRVIRYSIDAESKKPLSEEAHTIETVGFILNKIEAVLETKDEKHWPRPPFTRPSYPIHAEGHIISEIGNDGDRSYQIYADPDTSIDQYKVNILLWNKKIMTPYHPNLNMSHFYYPLVRDARVLVELELLGGHIVETLDWSPEVRRTQDSQGNHILFGLNATSYTTLSHVYKSSKPELLLQRLHGQDSQSWTMTEGDMTLEVKEDENAKKVDEKYSIAAQVAAAKGELAGEGGAAVAGVAGQFEAANAELNGEIEGAISGTEASLDESESRIDGVVAETRGAIHGALAELGAKVASMDGAASEARSALMGVMTL